MVSVLKLPGAMPRSRRRSPPLSHPVPHGACVISAGNIVVCRRLAFLYFPDRGVFWQTAAKPVRATTGVVQPSAKAESGICAPLFPCLALLASLRYLYGDHSIHASPLSLRLPLFFLFSSRLAVRYIIHYIKRTPFRSLSTTHCVDILLLSMPLFFPPVRLDA